MGDRKVKTLIIVLTSVFMFSIAGSRPLIPLFADDLGATNFHIGLLVAFYSLIPLFISVKLGRLVDHLGSKKFLNLGLLTGGMALIIPFFLENLLGVLVSQVFAGLSQVIFVVAMQSYAGGFSNKKIREYFVNIFSISVALGSFLGPLMGGLVADMYGFSISLISGGILLIAITPLVYFLNEHEKIVDKTVIEEAKFKVLGLLKVKSLQYAFVVSALILLAKDTYIAFFPLLAREYGINSTTIGFIISLNAAAGILIRLMLPFLIDHMSRRRVINLSILMSGIIFLLNPLINSVVILSILSFILGIGLGIGQPLSISSTVESLPKNKIGEGLGLRLTINRLTQILTPVTVGGLATLFGISSVFYCTGAIVIGGILRYVSDENKGDKQIYRNGE